MTRHPAPFAFEPRPPTSRRRRLLAATATFVLPWCFALVAAAQTPFGGDDTGSLPSDGPKGPIGKCEIHTLQLVKHYASCVLGCHAKRANGKLSDATAEENCKNACGNVFDNAQRKLKGCPACLDPAVVRSMLGGSIDSQNGLVFCEGYAWVAGAFGACSVECGGGTQTRQVKCEDNLGDSVSDSFCAAQTPPASSQVCNTQPCVTYSWVAGAFGACSVECGGGTETRQVTCEDNLGDTVADSFCAGQTPPPSVLPCNTQPCPTYSWVVGAFGPCSVPCGGGTATRSVTCEDNLGSAVADSFCSGQPEPPSQLSCNTQACP